MAWSAQNEMRARHAMPLRVRLTDGLGRWLGNEREGRWIADRFDREIDV